MGTRATAMSRDRAEQDGGQGKVLRAEESPRSSRLPLSNRNQRKESARAQARVPSLIHLRLPHHLPCTNHREHYHPDLCRRTVSSLLIVIIPT